MAIAGCGLLLAGGCGDNISSANGDGGNGPVVDGSVVDTPAPGVDAPPVVDAPMGDAGPLSGDPTLLISEVALANNAREFIEIVNPTDQTVDLTNYYLCDDSEYYLLPGFFGDGPAPSMINANADPALQFDFLVKFPDGATIAPGQAIVVAMRFTDFSAVFGMDADYGILQAPAAQEMEDPGGALFVGRGGNAQFSVSGGEMVALFHWDGVSDLVQDIDLVNVGMNAEVFNQIPNKTDAVVDGPDLDTTASRYADDRHTIGLMDGAAAINFSHKRIALEGSAETIDGFGNGLTGHDETSEDLSMTWDLAANYTAPTPGSVPAVLMP